MNSITTFLVLVFSVCGGYCQDSGGLPSPNEFLTTLLNTTINDLGAIFNNFQFITISREDITFLLYLENNETVELTSTNALQYLNSDYETKIIIHGWTTTGTADWIIEMASLYHQKGGYNVISVDWGKDADQNYIYSASAVQYVGNVVADFISKIYKQISGFLEKIHVIGHSLGAQVSGFVGQKVEYNTGKKLDRITGLDAAGPFFEGRPANLRLSEDDAKFVDLIHTDSGFYGVSSAYGTVDFYVNKGGPIQPQCSVLEIGYGVVSCSHQASHVYFSETILNPNKYIGIKCSSTLLYVSGLCNNNVEAVMGDSVSRNATGSYYVTTDDNETKR